MKKYLLNYVTMTYYEWLKLRKHKLAYLCLLLLLMFPFLAIKTAIDDTVFTSDSKAWYPSNEVVDLKSKELLSGLEAMRYVDATLHEALGNPNPNISSSQELMILTEKYLSDEDLDNEIMIEHYGMNWKSLLEKSRNGTLTTQELKTAQSESKYNNSDTKEDASTMITIPELFYQEQGHRLLETHQLLGDHRSIPELDLRKQSLMTLENQELWLSAMDSLANLDHDNFNTLTENRTKPFLILRNIDQPMMDFLNNQYISASESFDSQIGIGLVLTSMNHMVNYSPLIFLLFVLLFAPLFHQEYTMKTDQILKPTKQGLKKQALAKISLCLGFTLLYGVLSLLLFWLIPFFLIGFHDLDIVFRMNDARQKFLYNDYGVSARTFSLSMSSLYLLSHIIFGSVLCALSSISKNSFYFLIQCILFMGLGFLGLAAPALSSSVYLLTYISPFTFANMDFLFRSIERNNFTYYSIGGYIVSNHILMWCIWGILCLLLLYGATRWYTKRSIENA